VIAGKIPQFRLIVRVHGPLQLFLWRSILPLNLSGIFTTLPTALLEKVSPSDVLLSRFPGLISALLGGGGNVPVAVEEGVEPSGSAGKRRAGSSLESESALACSTQAFVKPGRPNDMYLFF
jgi:hypothetical protein